jgi:hypothetical protein
MVSRRAREPCGRDAAPGEKRTSTTLSPCSAAVGSATGTRSTPSSASRVARTAGASSMATGAETEGGAGGSASACRGAGWEVVLHATVKRAASRSRRLGRMAGSFLRVRSRSGYAVEYSNHRATKGVPPAWREPCSVRAAVVFAPAPAAPRRPDDQPSDAFRRERR